MNFDRLRFVAERAEVGEEREALFAVTIPEERGSFRRFCELLGPRAVTEFNYRISDAKRRARLRRHRDRRPRRVAQAGRARSCAHGFATLDLTDDELAKQHVRHMVGGRSPLARDERLYRFVFPERPGALMRFLSSMPAGWNISLFHYRNQGADYGRILVGIQVPHADKAAFREFLRRLAYPCQDETDNPAIASSCLKAAHRCPFQRPARSPRSRNVAAGAGASSASCSGAATPTGSMGELEPLAVQLGLIQNSLKPSVRCAADRGLRRRPRTRGRRHRKRPRPLDRRAGAQRC